MPEGAAGMPPAFTFTHDTSASPFDVDLQTYLSTHSDTSFQYIGTGALVFDTFDVAEPRVLLIQRSAIDSMPNLWEVPGGGCDEEDKTILHAVARELWEESGLTATHIGAPVGDPHYFVSRSGKKVCKFSFVVQVERNSQGQVAETRLNPEEHQRFVWASEKEIRQGKAGDVDLEFAAKELESTVLLAFDRLEG